MPHIRNIAEINFRLLISGIIITLSFSCIACNGNNNNSKRQPGSATSSDSTGQGATSDKYQPANVLLVLPENPKPGEPFHILSTGGKNIRKAQIIVNGPSGTPESLKSKTGGEFPFWRIDDFNGSSAGKYKVTLIENKKEEIYLEFNISSGEVTMATGVVWKNMQGWDSKMETIYSVWISALFQGCNEKASWTSLHEVTRNPDRNFLYNYRSLGEDDPDGKYSLIMQPDCADNPFFLRAYFAWKLGLPFGYHLCDRGSLVRNPKTGQWITNETSTSKTNPVDAINNLFRKIRDGVHSGTARTALDDESSDYYPVDLDQGSLRPGIVFADPYGHTLILVGRVPQDSDHPGLLLAVDAQPDGTVGIKRFWKGNFLFNTTGVIGEPGFKAFRPIGLRNGIPYLIQNKSLTKDGGYVPFSLLQRKMKTDDFYNILERIINPEPLEPETALLDQIQALYEQLLVRVTSVANGEAYFKLHPGTVIPMPSSAAGIFLAGGQWEDFSTPNRDLRLLIAMDAVLDFPDLVARSPGNFDISGAASTEQVKKKLQLLLDKKVSELTVSYIHPDGSLQKLTVSEILKRRDAFEMAYNPNDGIEIRWGAPENSQEREKCHRHAPPSHLEKMLSVRTWFTKRLHPPT